MLTLPPQLLQIGPLPEGLQTRLAQDYRLHALWREPDPSAFLATHPVFDGAVTMSRHGCDANALRAVAGRVLACYGVGTERIDLNAARQLDVAVSNTPDVLTECVADLAWGLVLGVARQLPQADAFVRSGAWEKMPYVLGTRIHGKRLGIVGLGRIGMSIWRRAQGFAMPMRYHGPNNKPDVPGHEPDVHALAEWSDVLILACHGGPETRHLINGRVLKALGPRGILVNVARGSVVDESALAAAITSGELGGAGLDVFHNEPFVPRELIASNRVVLLPHIAAMTHETRKAMEDLVCANLSHYFQTGRVLTQVP